MTLGGGGPRKMQRVGSSTRLSSAAKSETLTDLTQKSSASAVSFNDPATADVILRLHLEPSPSDPPDLDAGTNVAVTSGSVDEGDVKLHLHSSVLRRSKYFSALLSDRWQRHSGEDSESSDGVFRLNLEISAQFGSIDDHLTVLQLLYTDDFAGSINSVSSALVILPVALELLFEECVSACVRFIEAIPWSEDEERRVLSVIPLLREEESRELLARVSPEKSDCSEEMLYGLIVTALNSRQCMSFPKALVAKLLRDFSSRDSVRCVLDQAFATSFNVVKESLEEYSSPDFRGDHNETEAIQRLSLHKAMTSGRHLLWLVERMIELNVADNAVKEWSDHPSVTVDFERAFREDAWRNIVPGLPTLVLRCTYKISSAVATGSILASRQVRMNLVKNWLPVLIVCRDNILPIMECHKPLYQSLEETFLKILSTLPLSDSKDLMQQCLSFSTREIEDCPHLVSAFSTWFRRATQPPQSLN